MGALGSKKIGNSTYMLTDWSLKSAVSQAKAKQFRNEGKTVKVIKTKSTKHHPTFYSVYVKKERKR